MMCINHGWSVGHLLNIQNKFGICKMSQQSGRNRVKVIYPLAVFGLTMIQPR